MKHEKIKFSIKLCFFLESFKQKQIFKIISEKLNQLLKINFKFKHKNKLKQLFKNILYRSSFRT